MPRHGPTALAHFFSLPAFCSAQIAKHAPKHCCGRLFTTLCLDHRDLCNFIHICVHPYTLINYTFVALRILCIAAQIATITCLERGEPGGSCTKRSLYRGRGSLMGRHRLL